MKLVINSYKENKIIFFLCLILSLFCLAYLTKGFYNLLLQQAGAIDLHGRWQEQQYIYRGLFPYNVRNGSPLIDPEIGAVGSGGYPPWAFFTGFIFFPPISWHLTRLYHVLLNIISLIILAIFSYQIGKPYGQSKACFTVISCLSISSHSTTLSNGQYGIVVNALLILMFWFILKYQNLLAGFFLGLALVKPNISATYFLILIIRNYPRAILACCSYIFIASLSIGLLVNLSPIYMLNQTILTTQYFVNTGYSGINILTYLGLNPLIATIGLALVFSLSLVIILYIFRHKSLLCLFALASVVGRLFTYHLCYDNVMLFFLLLAMFEIVLPKPQSINILLLALVLISLLIPGKMTDLLYVRISQSIIWIASAIYLLVEQGTIVQKWRNRLRVAP